MVSLQEQFLKAGLVDKNKAKQTQQEKSKQKKVERRTGEQSVDEAKAAAAEVQRKNAEKAREANALRDAAATQKAIVAQIAQMIQQNKQDKGRGDIAYNFTHGSKIERIFVSSAVQAHLVAGRLPGRHGGTGAARDRRKDRRARCFDRRAGQEGGDGGRRGRSVRSIPDP